MYLATQPDRYKKATKTPQGTGGLFLWSNSMKVIIAGGRDYKLTKSDWDALRQIDITEVVSGECSGVDRDGETYAHWIGVRVKMFPPDWKGQGRAAGPLRNRKMAQYADAVVLFPGGKGTDSMHKEACLAEIKIYDFRDQQTDEQPLNKVYQV